MKSAPEIDPGAEPGSEGGAILIFVLVLLTLVGVGVVPLLNAAFTNAKTTTVAAAVNNGFYAADGGAEYAIQVLRAGGDCSQPITVPSSLDGPGGLSVTVTTDCTSPGCSPTAPAILTVCIASSVGGGANEAPSKTSATVAIDTSVNTNTSGDISIESWSSAQS